MVLLDGKKIAEDIKAELSAELEHIKKAGEKIPHLATILVGDMAASQTYVKNKMKACEEVGIKASLFNFPASVTAEELLAKVESLNKDSDIDGFFVQLPLPSHLNAELITLSIDPKKDVDGFHPENLGKMMLDLPCFLPATPFGITEIIRRYNIETSGKRCVVIGRSHIVGMPMGVLMSRNHPQGNATVTVTHSKTRNLKAITQEADILIVAIGKPGFVTADMVKEGAVVIDVGINRVQKLDGKFQIKGDVDFETVAPKCSHISPVPGGVGSTTVIALLMNTFKAARGKKAQIA
ncbi:MAG: bifunctional 5,10-methylenetetrahydrofolate dehydrogenase/5,10-methenyltetrahydrofolate cyclohydrolase [Cytophagales bacterium]|nr:MAG: bifunctional 5,10-methylenetetrahydrofolate dehydrogenase/5,10-methenyltetrahydrofolate cyclohydrolase [Cytophagales bacterium]TAF61106.1 MAG: bifunctional 5,10-methylenetetrahydrofolate dehydrogenase/5,10-methenyltetrahydrofolate cyclohydrolase [Cytophagales bacterium]